MKKKIKVVLLILVVVVLILILMIMCIPPFVGKNYERPISGCGENLSFSSTIIYGEDCGSPVGNYDLCSTYFYNPFNKIITINCEGSENNKFYKKFQVLDYDERGSLILEQDGKKMLFLQDISDYNKKLSIKDQFDFEGEKLTRKVGSCTESISFGSKIFSNEGDCNGSWFNGKSCQMYSYNKENNVVNLGCISENNKFEIKTIEFVSYVNGLITFKIDDELVVYKGEYVESNIDISGVYTNVSGINEKINDVKEYRFYDNGIVEKVMKDNTVVNYNYRVFEKDKDKIKIELFDENGSLWCSFSNMGLRVAYERNNGTSYITYQKE